MSQELGGGATWRLPSRTRRKLAQQAADLLAADAGGTAVAPDTGEMRREIEIEMRGESKLISLAREALRKAPTECDQLGISEGLRAVLSRAEEARRRQRQQRIEASSRAAGQGSGARGEANAADTAPERAG
jgi:hypothetical protein